MNYKLRRSSMIWLAAISAVTIGLSVVMQKDTIKREYLLFCLRRDPSCLEEMLLSTSQAKNSVVQEYLKGHAGKLALFRLYLAEYDHVKFPLPWTALGRDRSLPGGVESGVIEFSE